MRICPICLFVNAAAAPACARCGKHRFDERAAGVSTMTADDGPAADSAPPADPCATTTTEAVSPVGSDTTRSKRPALPPPPEPAPTVFVPPDPSEVMTNPSPQATLGGLSGSRLVVKIGLEVVRGEKPGRFLAILEGRNVVGRAVTEPVDIDLGGQEPVERVWVSRKHAIIHFDGTALVLEDLNSLNGTFVNRTRLAAGSQRAIQPGDVIQFGTVQVRVAAPPA